MARLAEAPAFVGRAAVLPHDGGADGFQGLAIPQDKGLPLIGDADRSHVARRNACSLQRSVGARLDRCPDLAGVVLDPAGPGVVLGDLAIALPANLAVETDRDGGRAGGPFVER
jgi:hypothetical protein